MSANIQLLCAPARCLSSHDRPNAEWILTQYNQWVGTLTSKSFTLSPLAKVRILENVAPTQFKAKLDEPTLLIGSTSKQKNEQYLPIRRTRLM
jgi:hypothetical protein